jgi:cytochrome c oxidase subunit II
VSTGASTAGSPPGEPRHGIRIAVMWAVFTAILVPLVIWVVGPHIPPYNGSLQSHDQHNVNITLTAVATPVAVLIWVYFGYSIVVFRQRGEAIVDGPPLAGHSRVQILWLVVTSIMVLGLATYGTVGLFGNSDGAGGGQGPSPLDKPSPNAGKPLEIQVIGQQWLWTFRYPGYGGVETAELALPVNQEVAFHVTSLDVAHSFWAYELGVKADAIPGSDNVAYVEASKTESIQVRCAELCGLWHGHMNTTGQVMTKPAFAAWIAAKERANAGVTKYLPPYSHIYYPDPLRRAG